MTPGFDFHHMGLAVDEPETAFTFLRAQGYRIGESMADPLQRVNLALARHDSQPTIEVVWPGEGPSPIDKVLKSGPGFYHICYTTTDAEAALEALEARGMQIMEVVAPTPAVLFGGLKVSFHFALGFGLFELIHLTGDAEADAGIDGMGQATPSA
jgi:catechol 2,3-dioxygenase-like lactoylglutathione lyase family enzyme